MATIQSRQCGDHNLTATFDDRRNRRGWRVVVVPRSLDPWPPGFSVLGVYPTADAAFEAARVVLATRGVPRVCEPEDIDRHRVRPAPWAVNSFGAPVYAD